MTAEILEQVPTGRTIQALAQLVSGVSLNVPDVGGSRAMQQTYMSTRGLTSANNIVTVDGLMVNGLDGDGAVQQYFNQAMMEEMSYQTSGAGADVSPGGVRMNIVPKDGGNRFSGSFFSAWTDGALQGDNLTDDIIARGLRTNGGVDRIYDFNLAIGGPIKRDKLWFFTSGRMWSVDAPVQDVFVVPDGTCVQDRHRSVPQRRHLVRDGHRRPEHRERAAAPHLADLEQAQVLGLLRRDQQGARSRDELRRRLLHRLADLDLAALQLGGGEVHRHLEQPAAGRGRLLVQLRGIRHHQPGRRQQGGVHAPSGTPTPAAATRTTPRSTTAWPTGAAATPTAST